MKKWYVIPLAVLFMTAVSCGSYQDCRSQAKPEPVKQIQAVDKALS